MTEEDKEFQEFLDMFPNLPDPEHFPKCFAMCVSYIDTIKQERIN